MALREEGFWDEHYGNELKNFEQDGDEGEVWFGKGLTRKIVTWLIKKFQQHEASKDQIEIIDVGCGNGFFICELVDKFRSQTFKSGLKVVGIDYSRNSIDLSAKILDEKDLTDSVTLKQCNFLDSDQVNQATEGSKFDYIIDIGTYDAICLLASHSTSALVEAKLKYIKSILSLILEKSIFILASCNNTESELLTLFESLDGFSSHIVDRIETPKMKFGGKEGSQVTCLIIEVKKL